MCCRLQNSSSAARLVLGQAACGAPLPGDVAKRGRAFQLRIGRGSGKAIFSALVNASEICNPKFLGLRRWPCGRGQRRHELPGVQDSRIPAEACAGISGSLLATLVESCQKSGSPGALALQPAVFAAKKDNLQRVETMTDPVISAPVFRDPGLPEAQGLYSPAYEHDSCGVGFVVNMHGYKSHDLISKGLQILLNLNHRGAVGADPEAGDGCGRSEERRV